MFDQYLQIRDSKLKGAGKGVFTKHDIPRDEYVTELVGNVIDYATYVKLPKDQQLYVFYVSRNHILNTYDVPHFARYVNDAEGPANRRYKNNCIFVVEKKRVFIKSVKKIKKGSEILVSYGKDYW